MTEQEERERGDCGADERTDWGGRDSIVKEPRREPRAEASAGKGVGR